MSPKERITVCICTYKRPQTLRKLLDNLAIQKTEDKFDISLSIVDNDEAHSAEPVVREFLTRHAMDVAYAHDSRHNLALLRNLSLTGAKGEYVAFIDDDEYPIDTWLLLLYSAVRLHEASGVFGPVLPSYQIQPPRWIERGRMCERPRHSTGSRLEAKDTRTGNALVKRQIFADPGNLFDVRFSLGGEDDTLFERLIKKGYEFIWCDEAAVFEEMPPQRLKTRYFLKRAQLIGYMSYQYFKDRRPWHQNVFAFALALVKSAIYVVILPLSLLPGRHGFVKVLIGLSTNIAILRTALGLLKIERRDI